jgi:hypothetical protein
VTSPTYRVTKLAPGYDLGALDCGEPDYNRWLTDHATAAVANGSSMVYLLLEPSRHGSQERVVGYYAICPTMVVRDQVPKSMQRNLLRNAPGWLLTKLALDRSLRGDQTNHWGRQLLRDALETIVDAADRGGGQIIVVDADNPGLVDWYTRQGFIPTGTANLRMYMKAATARQYFGQSD